MRRIVAGDYPPRGCAPASFPAAIGLAIGIPTRNRAALAARAIESALRDAPGGTLVVVSDNSTDAAERERLERYCAHAGERVEYVRPPEPLPMPVHWDWLWRTIRDSADPSHISYLTDRFVFAAGALPAVLEVAQANPGRVVSYHQNTVFDEFSPVQLVQTPWTGRTVELDCRRLAELSSRGIYGDYLPRMLNSVAPVETLAELERRHGDVFGTVAPDYRFAYRCLALHDTVLYLDRPCLVEYAMPQSTGGGFRRGQLNPHAADYAAQLAEPRFGATPEPTLETLANAIFQEYCSVRAEEGGGRFPPVERRGYLATNAISVDRVEDPDQRAALRAQLRRLGWTRVDSVRHTLGVARAMAGYLARHPSEIRRTLRRQLVERPPGTPLAFVLSRLGLAPPVSDEFRFATAEEAIAWADANPRSPTPHAWHIDRLERAGAVVRR
jgi:hypothetical protein